MKTIKFIPITILILFFNISRIYTQEISAGTKFIVAGHLYPITKDQKKLNKFGEKVKEEFLDLPTLNGLGFDKSDPRHPLMV